MREMTITDILEQITGESVSRRALDDLIELSMLGRLLRTEYETLQEPLPDNIGTALRLVSSQIRIKQHERLSKRLMDAKIQKSRLMPAEERRAAVDAEIAALEAQLATK